MMKKGDVVIASGKLKKVVDFLADADKETIRLLASFFSDEASGPADAKKFKKPLRVSGVYSKEGLLEVEISKTAVWEEKEEYFRPYNPEEGAPVEVSPETPEVPGAAAEAVPS